MLPCRSSSPATFLRVPGRGDHASSPGLHVICVLERVFTGSGGLFPRHSDFKCHPTASRPEVPKSGTKTKIWG